MALIVDPKEWEQLAALVTEFPGPMNAAIPGRFLGELVYITKEMTSMKTTLPTDSQARKEVPLASGLLDYFPAALAEVAHVSFVGNEKHNPGEPLHWAREKSTDQADAIARHLLERGGVEELQMRGKTYRIRHSAALAWRALALLQLELEAAGAPEAVTPRPALLKENGEPIADDARPASRAELDRMRQARYVAPKRFVDLN